MRKLKITLAVVAASLAALLAIALFVEFDAPRLGQRILDSAGESAGIEVQAEGFRFTLRRGIVLENVIATTQFPGGTVVTTLDRVVLEHRLVPLLLGEVVVDRLLLENPVIEVINDEAPAASSPTAARTAVPLPHLRRVSLAQDEASEKTAGRAIAVHSASIVDGTLLLSTAGREPTTRVHDLDVELNDIVIDPRASSVAVGLSARGHIDVGEVHVAQRIATGDRALLTADGGLFTVTGLALTIDEGRLDLNELVVDLNPDPYTYRTSLSGNDIDLNSLLGVEESDALGLASIEMDAAGAGAETASIIGNGRIHLAAGRIPDIPALDQVRELLGLQLAGLRYEPTTIEFALGNDRVEVSPFEIVSETLRLQATGSLGIDGRLDGRSHVLVPRDAIDLGNWQGDFSDGLVEALTDEEGWVSIPLLINGTVEEPSVRPDSEALFAALQESAGRGLGKWLQGIIKRN